MLGRHVFHDAGYHGFEFRYGRGADRFVGRRDVVCPVGQMDAPQVCRGGADCRSRLGKQCVEFRIGHSFGEDGGVLRHDVDAHAGRRGAFAVGRVDLFECNQFARFELQPGDVVVRAPNAVVGSTTVILPSPVSGPLSSEPPQLQRSATASSGSIRVFICRRLIVNDRRAGIVPPPAGSCESVRLVFPDNDVVQTDTAVGAGRSCTCRIPAYLGFRRRAFDGYREIGPFLQGLVSVFGAVRRCDID